jgi:Uma2 family endonuclease
MRIHMIFHSFFIIKVLAGEDQQVGVKEYWVVHPVDNMVMVFTLGENGEYSKPMVYTEEDSVPVGIFKDLVINLRDIFKE